MKTLNRITRRITQHAAKEICRILSRQGYNYSLQEIGRMLYYDKRLRTWAVRVLIERYSRLDEGAVVCQYVVFTSRYYM